MHITVVADNRKLTHYGYGNFTLWNNTFTTLGPKLFQFVRYLVIMVLSMEQCEKVTVLPIIHSWRSITSRKCSNFWTHLDRQFLYEIVTKCKIEKI